MFHNNTKKQNIFSFLIIYEKCTLFNIDCFYDYEERIILIIDLERPKFIKDGTSDVKYSEELVNLKKVWIN